MHSKKSRNRIKILVNSAFLCLILMLVTDFSTWYRIARQLQSNEQSHGVFGKYSKHFKRNKIIIKRNIGPPIQITILLRMFIIWHRSIYCTHLLFHFMQNSRQLPIELAFDIEVWTMSFPLILELVGFGAGTYFSIFAINPILDLNSWSIQLFSIRRQKITGFCVTTIYNSWITWTGC